MFSIATDFKTLDAFAELNDKYRLISSFFGAPHDLGLDGGREFFRTAGIDSVDLARFVNNCNSAGIGFFFVFNTTMVEDKDLNNEKIECLLSATQDRKNGVICANETMRRFVKDNYPEFKLIASRIYNRVDVDGIKDLCKNYDLVVLPEQLNKDFELLKKIPAEKIELIVNSFCRWGCPNRGKHYKLISRINKKIQNASSLKKKILQTLMLRKIRCPKSNIDEIKRVRIEPNQIRQYLEMGFRNFKVLDRSNPPTAMLVEEYLREAKPF